MDENSRQRNLKFHGVYEGRSGDSDSDIDEVVWLLNDSSFSRSWDRTDINGSYRLGAANWHSRDQPRPLIITFCRTSDRISILRDRDLRNQLRQRGVRVGADLTVNQRETIQWYKNQGKVAYYRNGRLHVEEGYQNDSGNPSRHHSHTKDHYHTNRYDTEKEHTHLQSSSAPGKNNCAGSRREQVVNEAQLNDRCPHQPLQGQTEILFGSNQFSSEQADYECRDYSSTNWNSIADWKSGYEEFWFQNRERLDFEENPLDVPSTTMGRVNSVPFTTSQTYPYPVSDTGTEVSGSEYASCPHVPLEDEVVLQSSPSPGDAELGQKDTDCHPQLPDLSQEEVHVPQTQSSQSLMSPTADSTICETLPRRRPKDTDDAGEDEQHREQTTRDTLDEAASQGEEETEPKSLLSNDNDTSDDKDSCQAAAGGNVEVAKDTTSTQGRQQEGIDVTDSGGGKTQCKHFVTGKKSKRTSPTGTARRSVRNTSKQSNIPDSFKKSQAGLWNKTVRNVRGTKGSVTSDPTSPVTEK